MVHLETLQEGVEKQKVTDVDKNDTENSEVVQDEVDAHAVAEALWNQMRKNVKGWFLRWPIDASDIDPFDWYAEQGMVVLKFLTTSLPCNFSCFY